MSRSINLAGAIGAHYKQQPARDDSQDRDPVSAAQNDGLVKAMESNPDWFATLTDSQQSEIKGWSAFRAQQAARKEGNGNE